jgi:hypothetical protein
VITIHPVVCGFFPVASVQVLVVDMMETIQADLILVEVILMEVAPVATGSPVLRIIFPFQR